MIEYKTETLDWFEYQEEKDRLRFLQEQGKENWELIKEEEDDEIKWTFWFKRVVSDILQENEV